MLTSELQKMANKLYKKYFNKTLKCNVCFNPRLRTTGGRFVVNRYSKNHHIEINPKVIGFSEKEPQDTIKHELIHYHLFITGQPYGHNMMFKMLAEHLHCNLYMPAKFGRNSHTLYHIYQCQTCGAILLRKRGMNTHKFVCANKIKDNWGMTTTCDGTWKACGTITVAQLKKKNNKVDRLKKNFKHKENVKHRLFNKLNHILGYKNSYISHINKRADIQGELMNTELGKLLPKLSSHAQKQFINILNGGDTYTPKQAIMKMHNYHMHKDDAFYGYVSKSVPKITEQIHGLSDNFVNLQVDTEAGLGWFLSKIDDSMFLDAMNTFIDENYTNGVKLFKAMTKFMKKHSQDYKKIEAKNKVRA